MFSIKSLSVFFKGEKNGGEPRFGPHKKQLTKIITFGLRRVHMTYAKEVQRLHRWWINFTPPPD